MPILNARKSLIFSMKKPLIAILICICIIVSCQPKERIESPSISLETIESIAHNFFTALGTGDTTLLNKVLSNDFIMFEHDEVWNTDSLLSLMPNTIGREWSIQDLKVSQSGNLAHVYYFNQGTIPADRSWLESMLMEQNGEALKIKFMHSTKLYLK